MVDVIEPSNGRGGAAGRRRRVRSMSDQVTDTVRRMILMGELRPTDQVTQDALAAELGVSTMPVREALLQLSHEGFIVGGRGRSFRVARTTRRDIADIYWMHATLAGELTARACELIDESALAELKEVNEAWARAVKNHDASGLQAANFEFHRLINQGADAPKLLRLMGNTLRMIPEDFYAMVPDWAEASTQSHDAILAAIEDRDPERARREAAKHVSESGAILIEFFDEKGYWTSPESRE